MSNSTTLVHAISTTAQNYIDVTSTTGFSPGKVLRVDQEAMTVLGVEGLMIHVMRGVHGTVAMTHLALQPCVVGDPRECIFPAGAMPIGSDIAAAAGETVGNVTVLVDGALMYIPIANHHH